ncbi:hypothetical protein GH714_027090 [Hevea brasiliensis]|uniref:Uncharacterized protein n=1 Tax=Hevea brasiliensis TaxID=3981 RepID=A0A6A6LRL1_HEVBR|nr:hypothetical protein GH714_027090 [Hevea brasiliensis]
MGRRPCCAKEGVKRGAWSASEDKVLINYIKLHGEGKWRDLPRRAGLKRCGKSCRLRWLNYLRPDIKRGNISVDEEDLIIRLHKLLGNRWSLIAGRLPGRTDNEIKNYWNSNLRKRVKGEKGSRCSSKLRFDNLSKRKNSPPPPPPGAVQTKPVTCSKVVIIPQALEKEQVIQKKAESKRTPSCSALQQEDSSLDLDFDIDDFLLLEAPNSELDQAKLNINGNALGPGDYGLNNLSSCWPEFPVSTVDSFYY